ncbi:MAG: hypothetical protein AB7G11_13740 [Phycisphaerales bacterium]
MPRPFCWIAITITATVASAAPLDVVPQPSSPDRPPPVKTDPSLLSKPAPVLFDLAPLWLLPDRFDAMAGENTSLSLSRGSPPTARAVPIGSLPTDWAFSRLRGVQENRDSLAELSSILPAPPAKPDAPAADDSVRVSLPRDGVAMIACDFAPRTERIESATLLDALKGRLREPVSRDIQAASANKTHLSVRLIESAKCLIRVAPADGSASTSDAQTVITKAGQFSEIRFTMDPTRQPVGGDVQFRIFAGYDKADRSSVIATCVETGESQVIEVDPSATGLIHLTTAGTWRVQFTAIRILKNDLAADIEVLVATATFKTMPKEAGR